MPEFRIRRTALTVEEIHHEGGPAPHTPRIRASIVAVVSNPFAGRYVADIQGAMEDLKPLGETMASRLVEAMGGPGRVDAYGKGAIVGEGGEIEHGALWHVPGGYAMRALVSPSKAIVPSAMKVGGMGARLDVPLGHVNAAYVRSHFDAMEVGLPDGPRAGEILFALAMSQGGRVHSRMGGLEAWDVTGEDGLR
ncbi:amino acid synthesis family protein [Albimonas pacifica]|uniref:Amino acid synthesis n=1 Tax=Albimonas pacifica TaxID=1114924 RepID=A0A1I3BG44_9RHOB|nr:amino acid synthesis family protein [Albimonas pacifica]SFH61285.1 Amino acid synthesis [Albimonas pacifica]